MRAAHKAIRARLFCGVAQIAPSKCVKQSVGGPAAACCRPVTGRNQEVMMARDPLSNFEIPGEMRQFAEQSVAQAKAAFDGFITAAQKAVHALEGQTAAAQAGAKDVSQKAIGFAEQNVTTSFEFAQKLVRAQDVQEVMRLQAEFIKTQMAALAEQAKELGETATKAAMDATKPK
jgi:phasin